MRRLDMRFRILEILKEQKQTKYWLYIRLGLSYQNFNKLVNNQTGSIKLANLQSLCDILGCTPNELFDDYLPKPPTSPQAPQAEKPEANC